MTKIAHLGISDGKNDPEAHQICMRIAIGFRLHVVDVVVTLNLIKLN